jgi:hypothetical protein
MNLKDIKGTYDAIFSLGDLCLASLQLRKNNLRPFSGVLDWMASPSLSNVNRLLQNRFVGFMDLPNLKATGYSTGVDSTERFICVWDSAYDIVSSHDFKADKNTLAHLATYPEVKEKFNRRIQRFLEKTATSQRLLFVRTEGTYEEVQELQSVLSGMVKNDFQILLINHSNVSGMIKKDWSLEKVCVVELPDQDKWSSNDHHWKTMLDGIHISV